MKFRMLLPTLMLACKGGNSDCENESYQGTAHSLLNLDGPPGGVSGEVTWPDIRFKEGLVMQFSYEFYAFNSLFSENHWHETQVVHGPFGVPRTCGDSMSYGISGIESGEYRILVRVNRSPENADNGSHVYLAEGRSELVFIGHDIVTDVDVELYLLD